MRTDDDNTRPTILAAEVGGTFTDVIVADPDGEYRLLKTPSNRAAPDTAVFDAIGQLSLDMRGFDRVVHGTTVGTNALLERRGASAALIVTRGFRDILELQREWKDRNYNLRFSKPTPLIPQEHILESQARMTAQGASLVGMSDDEIERLIIELSALEVEAVAICLLNAYRDGQHERRLADTIRTRFPDLQVHSSHEVAPEIREFERTSTTVLSAYIGATLATYLDRMERRLAELGFSGSLLVTQCNGGLATPAEISHNAAASLLSGPAAGVEGALAAARRLEVTDFVTMDVGGTSTDLSLVRGGQPTVANHVTIERWPLAIPLVDVRTVGAGGGSIVAQGPSGLAVGPRSAGADPGPAAYGRGGTDPTLTDALAVAGYLRDGRLLGGTIPVDRAAAEKAFAGLAASLDDTVEVVAEASIALAVAELAHQLRLLTLEQGLDPRDFRLVAYGGAGPMFAGWVTQELGLGGVVVPAAAGLLSAVGLLVAPYRRDYVATLLRPVEEGAPEAIMSEFETLEAHARVLARRHIGTSDVTLRRTVDLRYVGQGFELPVDIDGVPTVAGLEAAFNERHENVFGYHMSDDPIEVVRCRLTVERSLTDEATPVIDMAESPAGEPAEASAADGGRPGWTFASRGAVTAAGIEGPCVIETPDSTIIVPEGMVARRPADGVITLE